MATHVQIEKVINEFKEENKDAVVTTHTLLYTIEYINGMLVRYSPIGIYKSKKKIEEHVGYLENKYKKLNTNFHYIRVRTKEIDVY